MILLSFKKKKKKLRLTSVRKVINSQALVAHACNPRYSGGRDQEDHDLKPGPILKKGWWSSSKCKP
jgi:hypothetical protein